MNNNVLFLTLKVFSVTGGIEKVSRIVGKALVELGESNNFNVSIISVYDRNIDVDERYFCADAFEGFNGNKAGFASACIRRGRNAAIVLLSHINLLSIGFAIKKFSPNTKLVLLAHGIEVWQQLSFFKRLMLLGCDLILPVSQYTKKKMVEMYGLNEENLVVLNNCLDPNLPQYPNPSEILAVRSKYGFTTKNKVLLTVCRLYKTEQYKGYDEVIIALQAIRKEEPQIKYLIVGKWDDIERERLFQLSKQYEVADIVVFAGFVPDQDLAAHFTLADIFIMPSKKEGFGVVFIEALHYGTPVIAGSVDGSVDALAGGQLGILVNPDKSAELLSAIRNMLNHKNRYIPDPADIEQRFSYRVYKQSWQNILSSLLPQNILNRVEYSSSATS